MVTDTAVIEAAAAIQSAQEIESALADKQASVDRKIEKLRADFQRDNAEQIAQAADLRQQAQALLSGRTTRKGKKPSGGEVSEQAVLADLSAHPEGTNGTDIAERLGANPVKVRAVLKNLTETSQAWERGEARGKKFYPSEAAANAAS